MSVKPVRPHLPLSVDTSSCRRVVQRISAASSSYIPRQPASHQRFRLSVPVVRFRATEHLVLFVCLLPDRVSHIVCMSFILWQAERSAGDKSSVENPSGASRESNKSSSGFQNGCLLINRQLASASPKRQRSRQSSFLGANAKERDLGCKLTEARMPGHAYEAHSLNALLTT